MSLAIKIYKKQRNIILVLVKKSDGIIKFTCLKTVFPSLLKKLRSLKNIYASLYFNISLYYITPFPLGNYIQFNREQ